MRRTGPISMITLLFALPPGALAPAGALAAARPPPSASAASADPIRWDAARCGVLAVRAGREDGRPGALAVAPWTVTLDRTGGGEAGRIRVRTMSTDGPPALDRLAPLFAGGLLVGMEKHRPHACDLAHSFREAAAELASLGPGQSASELWSGVHAVSEGSNADATLIRVEATHDRDGTARLVAETQGFSAAGNDMTAEPIERSRVAVSMPFAEARRLAGGGALGDDDAVTIDQATIATGDGHVEATGTYTPATRQGRFHVVATDVDDLKDALPVGERTEAGAAFLMLRLAGRSAPDGATAWDVIVDDAHMTINGIPLPLP